MKQYGIKGDWLYLSNKLNYKRGSGRTSPDRTDFITETSIGCFGGELVMLGSKNEGGKEAAQA